MGATYTRQSSSGIVDGGVIEATDINNEFDQLLAAFAVSSGHTHDGTAAEGGPITKLLGTAITIGDGTSGTDIAVTFDGETGDGVLTWMEDEDYFKFSDDILMNSTERLNFGDTGTYIFQSTDGQLDIIADTEVQIAATTIDINGAVDISGALTFAGTTLAETISDTVGAMVSSNTETGIAVTYDDSDNTLDFVIGADVIVNSMIADDAIDSAQIADGSIDTAHIADDQVTGAKLSNDVTIANDLTVSGDLVVTGSTTQTGSLLSNSNFQALSQNNSGNSTDFGFYGKYVESSTTKYAGLAFDASTDNTFRLFVDTQTAPGSTVNTGATGYAAGILIAGEVSMTTLDIGGTDVTSTAAELNILDGVTSTAAELNILDGVTATAAELNYSDGVTSNIQTQLDTKATTGKAIAMALVFG